MIRSYCFDTEKDKDEGIHLLLFTVQESFGFNPFELMFSHTLKLLKLSTFETFERESSLK